MEKWFIWKKIITLVRSLGTRQAGGVSRKLSREEGRPERVRLLRYAEILEYFAHNKPDNPRIKKKVILIHSSAAGHLVTLLYVDAEIKPVHVVDCDRIYGKKILAKHLDDELRRAFQDAKMIILD